MFPVDQAPRHRIVGFVCSVRCAISKVALAVLSRRGAVAILDRFLEQMVSVDDVHAWADAIESRDDVGFEPGFEEVLKDLLSDLASPELSEPLSHKKALDWIRRLSGS